jgi:hypothetical protein
MRRARGGGGSRATADADPSKKAVAEATRRAEGGRGRGIPPTLKTPQNLQNLARSLHRLNRRKKNPHINVRKPSKPK